MVRAREETQEGVRRRRRRVRCRMVRRVGPVVGIRAVEGRRAVGEEEGGVLVEGVVVVVVLDAVGLEVIDPSNALQFLHSQRG